MTEVFNLATGEVMVFSLPPEKAVVVAFEASRRNFNTWEYDYTKAKKCKLGTFVCGDWAARPGKDK